MQLGQRELAGKAMRGAGRPSAPAGSSRPRPAPAVRALPDRLAGLQAEISSAAGRLPGDEAWHSLQPHFGGSALAGAVSAAQAQLSAAQAQVSTAASGLVPEALLEPLRSSLAGAGSLALPPLPSLPALPALPALLNVAALEGLQPHWGTAAASAALRSALQAVGNSEGLGLQQQQQQLARLLTQLQAAGQGLVDQLPSLPAAPSIIGNPLPAAGAALSAALAQAQALAQQAANADPQQLLDLLASLPSTMIGGHSLATLMLSVAATMAAVAASTPGADYAGPGPSDPRGQQLTTDYEPEQLARYWRARPVAVAQRSMQVATEAAAFGLALLADLWAGKLAANERQRAVQLRSAIERMGPAFIKVAQAVSTRIDLLTPAYFEQIALLQDRVPPFPDAEARAAMTRAFGQPLETVFESLSEQPVAAASLGQVYHGKLAEEAGGGEVAVKVQRPDVLQTVALDLYLMRSAAQLLKRLPAGGKGGAKGGGGSGATDWAALIDSWALRFFNEMDYVKEADNALRFSQQMADAGLAGIQVAEPLMRFTTPAVLTTRWVAGEKLGDSSAADVRELCTTLLNCYLIQLLDTGFLHADPHPGNLLRTPEGKICILDFGLMTEVSAEQRIALVEYIAHLTTQDWPGLSRDLQTLGFIPPEVDPGEAGLVAPLGAIMAQLVGGGGAAKVNIDKVVSELEALSATYPFSVPPFFALILRAFSVIEGIALGVDPDYAIVQECWPYLVRRLLSDEDPRVRAALRDVLYGGRGRRHIDVARLARMVDGLAAFTTEGLTGQQQQPTTAMVLQGQQPQRAQATAQRQRALPAAAAGGPRPRQQPVDATLRLVLNNVFSPRGSYVQELLVQEAAAAADALSREALNNLLGALLRSSPAALASSAISALGPFRPVLLPVPTVWELAAQALPAVAVTEEDEEVLDMVRGLAALAQRLPAGSLSGSGVTADQAGPLLAELAPGLAATLDKLLRAFAARLVARATLAIGASGPGSGNAGSALDLGAMRSALDFAPRPRAQLLQQQQQQGLRRSNSGAVPMGLSMAAAQPLLLAAGPAPPAMSSGGLATRPHLISDGSSGLNDAGRMMAAGLQARQQQQQAAVPGTSTKGTSRRAASFAASLPPAALQAGLRQGAVKPSKPRVQ